MISGGRTVLGIDRRWVAKIGGLSLRGLSAAVLVAAAVAPMSASADIWIRDDFNGTAGNDIQGTQPNIYGPGGSATWVSRNPSDTRNPEFATFGGESVARFEHNGSSAVNQTISLGTIPPAAGGKFTVSAKFALDNDIYSVNGSQGFLMYLADTTAGVNSGNAFGIRFGIDTTGANAGRLRVFNIAETQLGSSVTGIAANTYYVASFDVDGTSVTGVYFKNMAGTTLYSYTTPQTYSPTRSLLGLQQNTGSDTPPAYTYVDYVEVSYVPEPATAGLGVLGLGGVLLGWRARRRVIAA